MRSPLTRWSTLPWVTTVLVAAACPPALPPPPEPPTVEVDERLTAIARQLLRGTKPASTAVLLDDVELVPLDEATTWSAWVDLREGPNKLGLRAADSAGQTSSRVPLEVLLDTLPPSPPVLDVLPSRTTLDSITVTGSRGANDRIVVNGSIVSGGPTATTLSVTLPLALGTSSILVASLDDAGNESDIVSASVERIETIVFDLVPPPARVATTTITLTGVRGPDVAVRVNGAEILPPDPGAEDAGSPWSADVVLVDGANDLVVSGELRGEPESAIVENASVTVDRQAPRLSLSAPIDGSIAASIIPFSMSATDDDADLLVEVCAGTCADDADFVAAASGPGGFTAEVDLSQRSDLVDGDLLDVVVRARDAAGNEASETATLLLARAPIVVGAAPGTTVEVELAGTATGGAALAWVNDAGELGVSVDGAGGSFAPTTNGPLVNDGADVRVATSGSEVHLAWLAGGSLFHEELDDGALPAPAVDGSAAPVSHPALTLLADGTPVVAFVQDGIVRAAGGAAVGFGAPIDVSDATTTAPSDVFLVADANDILTVIWAETSDRDLTLDDADIVARRVDLRGAPPGPTGDVILVSASAGTFVDGASSSPAAAQIQAGVAVAWIDEGDALLAVIDDATFAGGVPPAPVVASAVLGAGAASAVRLAGDGTSVVVGWLDDGAGLLGSAAAPALVLRAGPVDALGEPRVLSSTAASSPSLFLDGATADAAWVEGGDVRFFPMELP